MSTSAAERVHGVEPLTVPEQLLPPQDSFLPKLNSPLLRQLGAVGWQRVGIMVAFVDELGDVMMLEHYGRDKNGHGELGPLGETSQSSGPVIEQPLETLYRGIQEELGVSQPDDLNLMGHATNGWAINQWPRGTKYPGQFSCAISFPVFISEETRDYLLSIPHGSEEISSVQFVKQGDIAATSPASLRPGVHGWLDQLQKADLLNPAAAEGITPIDFSTVFSASLHDIDLPSLL